MIVAFPGNMLLLFGININHLYLGLTLQRVQSSSVHIQLRHFDIQESRDVLYIEYGNSGFRDLNREESHVQVEVDQAAVLLKVMVFSIYR